MPPKEHPEWRDPKPRMTRRNKNHDYCASCIYMITIRAKEDATPLSHISQAHPGKIEPQNIHIFLTPAGKAIQTELNIFTSNYPTIRLLKSVVMPDHIHFIIYVTVRLPRPLWYVISNFMGKCSSRFWRENPGHPLSQSRTSLFTKGFNDRILYHRGQLQTMINYIEQNPYRYLIRKTHRAYFYKTITLTIGNSQHKAYGNFLLLRNPMKSAIIVSSKYTPEQLAAYQAEWEETSRQGGVLIGAFVSKAEQAVKQMGLELGAKIIEIKQHGFNERHSPGPQDLDICAEGRLLEIGFLPPTTRTEPFDRRLCLSMNAFARRLAALPPEALLSLSSTSGASLETQDREKKS